jgi:hypothetical protein
MLRQAFKVGPGILLFQISKAEEEAQGEQQTKGDGPGQR